MPGWVEETMAVTTNPSPALEVALAYFRRLDAPGFRPRNDLHRREHTVRTRRRDVSEGAGAYWA